MTRKEWIYLKEQLQFHQSSWPSRIVIVFDVAVFSSSLSLFATHHHLLSTFLLTWSLLHSYLLLHEATHSALSTKKGINDLVGHICGWLIIMPYLCRQRSHLLHHVWT